MGPRGNGYWARIRPRVTGAWSSPHSSVFCLAALQRRPVLYHSRWLLIVLWPWPSVHLGQLAPTTLPQCRLVSNPCSAGLSLSLSLWPFALWASLSFSAPCPLPLPLCLSLPLSLCLALSLPSRPFFFSLSPPSPGGFFVSLPLTPPCWLSPVRHIAVRMAACSAACRGTVQRLRIPGLFA